MRSSSRHPRLGTGRRCREYASDLRGGTLMSFRLRLALFGTAVVALTLVLFGALLYGLLARGVATNQDDALRGRAGQAAAALNAAPDIAPRSPLAPADLRTSTEIFVAVLDRNWSVVDSTGVLDGAAPPIAARLRGGA